jgi:hypothetical protein
MKELIFLIFLILGSNIAYAEVIKLSCDLVIDEIGKKRNYHEIITIEQTHNFTFITPSGNILYKVDSKSIDQEVKITNLSTKNHWHIFNESKFIDSEGQMGFFLVNFKIDRNTGALFYQHSTKSSNNYSNIVNANGLCNKVDSTKNKF